MTKLDTVNTYNLQVERLRAAFNNNFLLEIRLGLINEKSYSFEINDKTIDMYVQTNPTVKVTRRDLGEKFTSFVDEYSSNTGFKLDLHQITPELSSKHNSN